MGQKITDLDGSVVTTTISGTDVFYAGKSTGLSGEDYFTNFNSLKSWLDGQATALSTAIEARTDLTTFPDNYNLLLTDSSQALDADKERPLPKAAFVTYINGLADARIGAASIGALSNVDLTGLATGNALVFDGVNFVPGASDSTATYLNTVTGKGASKALQVNSSNDGYEWVTPVDQQSVDDAEAVAVLVGASPELGLLPSQNSVTPGTGDNATALAAMVALADTETYGSNRIAFGPGEYRSNSLALNSSKGGLYLDCAGEHVTHLTTATDNQAVVRFGVTHASARTQGYVLENASLSYQGTGEMSAGTIIEMYNTQKSRISNVTLDAVYAGLLLDACQHTVVEGFKTSTSGRTTAAGYGIKVTSSQAGLNAAGNYLERIELSFGAPGAASPAVGLDCEQFDGLYINQLHCQGAVIAWRVTPATGTTQDYALSLLATNIYLDACTTSHFVLEGTADQAFGKMRVSVFEFRNCGGDSCVLNPSSEVYDFALDNGIITQVGQTALYVGANMNGVKVTGVTFDDNNTDNGANDGDIDIIGDNVSISHSTFVGGGANGFSVRVDPSASNPSIRDNDFTQSTAGTILKLDGGPSSGFFHEVDYGDNREVAIHKSGNRDFTATISGANTRVNVIQFRTQPDQVVQFHAYVNVMGDDGSVNTYEIKGHFKNAAGDATFVNSGATTVVLSNQEDAPGVGNPCEFLIGTSANVNLISIAVRAGASITTSSVVSGRVYWESTDFS